MRNVRLSDLSDMDKHVLFVEGAAQSLIAEGYLDGPPSSITPKGIGVYDQLMASGWKPERSTVRGLLEDGGTLPEDLEVTTELFMRWAGDEGTTEIGLFRMGDLCVWLQDNLMPGECDGTWRKVDEWCEMYGLNAEFVKQKAGGRAGCDCELILNVFLADDRNQFLPPGTVIPKKGEPHKASPMVEPESSAPKEV